MNRKERRRLKRLQPDDGSVPLMDFVLQHAKPHERRILEAAFAAGITPESLIQDLLRGTPYEGFTDIRIEPIQ